MIKMLKIHNYQKGKILFKLVSVVLFVLLSVGCAWQIPSTEFTGFSSRSYPSRPLDYQIDVYRTSLPDRKYEELGIAIADGGGFGVIVVTIGNSYQNAIERLKAEARLQGGDAVIDLREATSGDSSFVTLTASIVRWK